jgi:dTMP kinase
MLADPSAVAPDATLLTIAGSGSVAAPVLATVTNDVALRLVNVLRRNKVSLLPALACDRPDLHALLSSPPLAQYLAEEELAYRRSHREYATIRAAFARAGFADVLIKSAGIAPSFPHLSDNIDDLVPDGCVGAARAALLALGYVELRNLEEPRKFFFKRFAEGQEVAAHHLHQHVGWAVSFLDEPFLLQRARPAPDDALLLIPHPEDAYLITVAHAFYENKAFKLGDLIKVRQCLRSGELDWARMRALTRRKGWLDGHNLLISAFSRLDEAIYGDSLFPSEVVAQAEREMSAGQRRYVDSLLAGELQMPLRVSFGFSKRLFYAKCRHDRERSTAGRLYDIVRHTLNGAKLKLKVHSQPGMLITCSGIDGAGKTRHARALVNALERCDIRASYVWSRTGSSRFTDAAIRIGKGLLRRPPSAPGSSQDERANGRRQVLRNPLARLVWISLVTVDLLWQYTRHVRLPLLVGRVVVCDRYVYDAIADMAGVTGQDHSIFYAILTALSPCPDKIEKRYLDVPPVRPRPVQDVVRRADWQRAAFVLTVPESTVAARRPEEALPAGASAGQLAIYQSLAVRHNLVMVDNSLPFGEVNDALVRSVIRAYFARYHTLINGLLMANPMPLLNPKGLRDP